VWTVPSIADVNYFVPLLTKICNMVVHDKKLHHPSPLHQTKPHEQARNADTANLHRRQHWIARNLCYGSMLPGALNNSLNGFSNFVTHIDFRSTVAASLSIAAISTAGLGTENKSLPRIARPIK
jgi:hypothetical protein